MKPLIGAIVGVAVLVAWWVTLLVVGADALFLAGQVLVVVAALGGVALVRAHALERLPRARKFHLDLVIVASVLIGHVVSSVGHVGEVRARTDAEADLEALRDYSYVARLTLDGTSGRAGAGLKETTELSRMLEATVVEREGKLFPRCDQPSLNRYAVVAEAKPRFPFAHYSLAVCLRRLGDLAWSDNAREAVVIFRKTTRLADHHPSHDEALREVERYLGEAS